MEMNKERVKEAYIAKLQIRAQDFDNKFKEKYDQALEEFTDIGLNEDEAKKEAERTALFRTAAHYKIQTMRSGEPYEGIILAISEVTDYGAKNKYDQIKLKYSKNDSEGKRKMIANGESGWEEMLPGDVVADIIKDKRLFGYSSRKHGVKRKNLE